MGVIQSVEGLNRKKRQRKGEFVLCLDQDICPETSALLTLRLLDSAGDLDQLHWFSDLQVQSIFFYFFFEFFFFFISWRLIQVQSRTVHHWLS